MKRFLFLIVCVLPATAPAQTFKSEDVKFFTEKVRPILEANCFKCHGGQDARGKVKIKSGLQLISRKGITMGGEHGPAFDEQEPEKSLLLRVIGYEDEVLKMPERGKLPDAEIAVLTDWVKRGLPWTAQDMNFLHEVHEEHTEITSVNATTKAFWSYKPLVRPAAPRVAGPWGKHPVDALLLRDLVKNGLTPNGPATRRELIRRASYGLTGLPPTLDEVQAFEKDGSPNAWEKLIDRLLASPQYGEKWARHWLDIVRYAESNGFERDSEKPHIWRYRDYVIDAFNADLPYDRFLLEQLAGDEIETPTAQSKIATGYHHLMQWDDEPADRLQHLFDNLDDNVRITSEGMLGMSLGCARCHDHKGDPLSQEDYYSFMAFFRGVKQPGKGNANLEKVGAGGADKAHAEAMKKYEADGKRAVVDLAETERLLKAQLFVAYPALRGRLSEKAGKLKPVIPDARSKKPAFWHYTTSKPAEGWSAVGFRAENAGWKQGLAAFGRKGTPGAEVRTKWETPELWVQTTFLLERIPKGLKLFLLHDEDVELYLNGQPVLQRKGPRGNYEEIQADRKFMEALQTGRNVISAHIRQTSGGQSFDLGISMVNRDSYTLEEALKMARKGIDAKLLAKRRELQGQIANHGKKRPEAGGIDAQVVKEHGKNPPALHVHIRGNANAKADTVVTTRIPTIWGGDEFVGTPPAHGRNTSGRRLALANWIIRPDNPRTSRVMMNRIWQHHFGRGICPTPNDFGYLGERPSHPELLDWLATEFVQQGWSMKKMHKMILMTQAYQMSSRGQAEGLAKDPANTYWWRFDLRRLTAEEVRDSILAATGRLNLKMGGPSVFVDLPEEVLATSSTKGGKWGKSSPEDRLRRSVYMKVKRSLVPPIMADFDLADTDGTCPVRFSSILPTQALALLNSNFANEEAKNFAARLRAEAPNDPKRQVALGLELGLSRPATQREIDYGVEFIEVMMRDHKLSSDESFNRFALLVLNLNEFMFID